MYLYASTSVIPKLNDMNEILTRGYEVASSCEREEFVESRFLGVRATSAIAVASTRIHFSLQWNNLIVLMDFVQGSPRMILG